MNRRGHASLKMWLMGAAAIGVPAALGMFGPDQAAFADGKLLFGTNAKKPTVKVSTAVATEAPRLLPVPDAKTAAIRTVSDSQTVADTGSGQKSEVMKQLELLYEKDGREMPDLQTIQPVPNGGTPSKAPASTKPAAAPAPNTAAQQRTQAIHSKTGPPNPALSNGSRVIPSPASAPATSASQPSKNPVTGFFKKLLPGNKEPKTTAAPPNYLPNVAPTPPTAKAAAARPHDYQPAQIRTGQAPVPPGYSTNSMAQRPAAQGNAAPSLSQQPNLQIGRTTPALSNVPTQPVATFGVIPPSPISDFGAELAGPNASTPALLPPLLSQPQSDSPRQLSAGSDNSELSLPKPTDNSNLENPFTEMSEDEADDKANAGPFTGLTLDDEAQTPSASTAETANGSKAAVPRGTDVSNDPFAEELRKLGILPSLEAKPMTDEGTPKLALPALDSPALEGIEDEVTREKMLKIRERGGMKGLKGFCPVTLHDERELVDAKSEFHATHRGQKFHFASAETKAKFDEDPSVYTPAAYGADVVALTRDKDVVEGSLDHAAWFKGRLYLFGSQDAHDAFVSNPVQYATPSGIE